MGQRLGEAAGLTQRAAEAGQRLDRLRLQGQDAAIEFRSAGGIAVPALQIAEIEQGVGMARVELERGAERIRRVARTVAGAERQAACVVIARSEEQTSERKSLMRSSYEVFCVQRKKHKK